MEGYQLQLLLSREQIASLIKTLADQISGDYAERELVLVCILKGAFMLLADLIRQLRVPAQVDFVRLASYGSGTKTSGRVEITKDIEISVEGKDVLIVEDIVDTGETLAHLIEVLQERSPASVRVCALLNKQARRRAIVAVDYIGFEVDDVFVVGCGLDFDERYRGLPGIYALPETTQP